MTSPESKVPFPRASVADVNPAAGAGEPGPGGPSGSLADLEAAAAGRTSKSPELADPESAELSDLARTERSALRWCALAAAALVIWITTPVGVGIFLGTLFAFTLQPVYERLAARWKRPGLASLATVGIALLGILATVAGLAGLFVDRGSELAKSLMNALSPGATTTSLVSRLSPILSRLGVKPEELTTRLQNKATEIASQAASLAEGIAAATAGAILATLFALMTMHVILRNWKAIALRAQETLPLRPDYTRALFAEFRSVGRTTLLGTIGTAIAQGVLATIGYWMCGVPEPMFFGAATAVASLLPVVGTLIIWVPAGIVLLLTGHASRGILELAWGVAVVTGVSDYVIRPWMVGGEEEYPTLITFTALFGGVEVFGLKGLILGPVAMSLGIAVLRLYALEMSEARRRLKPVESGEVVKG